MFLVDLYWFMINIIQPSTINQYFPSVLGCSWFGKSCRTPRFFFEVQDLGDACGAQPYIYIWFVIILLYIYNYIKSYCIICLYNIYMIYTRHLYNTYVVVPHLRSIYSHLVLFLYAFREEHLSQTCLHHQLLIMSFAAVIFPHTRIQGCQDEFALRVRLL